MSYTLASSSSQLASVDRPALGSYPSLAPRLARHMDDADRRHTGGPADGRRGRSASVRQECCHGEFDEMWFDVTDMVSVPVRSARVVATISNATFHLYSFFLSFCGTELCVGEIDGGMKRHIYSTRLSVLE
jgi:hypothetical protein